MTAKIRITATEHEIENWKAFLILLAQANVITLREVSENYPNRADSKYQRVYLEADLKIDVNSVESPVVQKLLKSNQS